MFLIRLLRKGVRRKRCLRTGEGGGTHLASQSMYAERGKPHLLSITVQTSVTSSLDNCSSLLIGPLSTTTPCPSWTNDVREAPCLVPGLRDKSPWSSLQGTLNLADETLVRTPLPQVKFLARVSKRRVHQLLARKIREGSRAEVMSELRDIPEKKAQHVQRPKGRRDSDLLLKSKGPQCR